MTSLSVFPGVSGREVEKTTNEPLDHDLAAPGNHEILQEMTPRD